MKTFTAALAVLFVAVFCYQATSSPISLNFYGPCCVKYITRPLPLSLVAKYNHTGRHCYLPAVIFTTTKNRMVCANLNEKWVQDIMKSKDNENSG
ncbi:CCL5 protein, partial [Myiagra hebetior]|nr:CCL5 protein [Myiagra hebetior]